MHQTAEHHAANPLLAPPRIWLQFELREVGFTAYCVGAEPTSANAAIVCIPNRSSSAERFIALGQMLSNDPSVSVISIGTSSTTRFWYPNSAFDASLEIQQPYLDISLAVVELICQRLICHIPINNISLFGFSEGACLALEYLARCGYPFNAVIALSGLLLGTSLDTSDRFNVATTRTKVFLSIGKPLSTAQRVRFRQTEDILKKCGYKVVTYTSERRPETISPAELEMAR
ncbi:MAG: hypothetical protein NZ481_09720, partial [Candidatus Kapabacteria bacterium]|nr:hypothetical protein [Candidatus Kapabacteria bacterium]